MDRGISRKKLSVIESFPLLNSWKVTDSTSTQNAFTLCLDDVELDIEASYAHFIGIL